MICAGGCCARVYTLCVGAPRPRSRTLALPMPKGRHCSATHVPTNSQLQLLLLLGLLLLLSCPIDHHSTPPAPPPPFSSPPLPPLSPSSVDYADAEHGGKIGGGGTSMLSTATLIIANMLGAGVLGLPRAVRVRFQAKHPLPRLACWCLQQTATAAAAFSSTCKTVNSLTPTLPPPPTDTQNMGWVAASVLLLAATFMSIYCGVLLGKLRGTHRKIKVGLVAF